MTQDAIPKTESAQGKPVDATRPQSAVHIDTTLQIERFKTPARAQKVKLALSDFAFRSTSTYARYEFARTLLRDLAYLYTIAAKARQIGDVLEEVKRSFGVSGGQKNRLLRCIEQISTFLGTRPQKMTVQEEVLRFREHVAFALLHGQRMWDRSVHHQFDGTGCIRAKESPSRAPNEKVVLTLPNCRREKIQCRIHQFFQSRHLAFQTIAQVAKSSASAQLQRAGQAIENAASDPVRLCDNRRCAEIGDAIIAIDGEQVPVLAANNDEDWGPIATALGKKLLNPLRSSTQSSPLDDRALDLPHL